MQYAEETRGTRRRCGTLDDGAAAGENLCILPAKDAFREDKFQRSSELREIRDRPLGALISLSSERATKLRTATRGASGTG